MTGIKNTIDALNDVASDDRKSIISAGVFLAMAAADIIIAVIILAANKKVE